MGYTKVPTVGTGDYWTASDANTYLGDNFQASVPDLFSAKGDLAIATQADNATALTASGTDYYNLCADSSQVTGVIWAYGRVPVGGIVIWSGAEGAIPANWALCDGGGTTPDLTDLFIVGSGDEYAIGASGGDNTPALDHTHSMGYTGYSSWSHTHAIDGDAEVYDGHAHLYDGASVISYGYVQGTAAGATLTSLSNHAHGYDTTTGSEAGHSHAVSTTAASGGSSHRHNLSTSNAAISSTDITPPYYALCYIQRTA